MDKIELLANYLGCDVNDIYEIDNVTYETDYGDFYVCDEDEAEDLVYQDIEQSIEDMGLDTFTPDFQNWIIENAVDKDDWFFEDVRNEAITNEIEDMSDEEIITECIDNFLVDEEEVEDYDIEELKEKLFYDLVESNPAFDYYIDYYGYDELKQDLANNMAILDMEAIVKECIEWDGIAHFIARYDGEEIDLGDDYFAYRYN